MIFKTKTLPCDLAVKLFSYKYSSFELKKQHFASFSKTSIMAEGNPLEISDDSDLSDLLEGKEAFIVSHITDDERKQYDYIRTLGPRS